MEKTPSWLTKGVDPKDNIPVKKTSKIKNIKDFKTVYNLSVSWKLPKFPLDIFVYHLFNENAVLKFLKSKGDKSLIDDLNRNVTILKYKHTIIDDFPETEKILKNYVYDSQKMKLAIHSSGYTSRLANPEGGYINIQEYEGFINYTYKDLLKIKSGDKSAISPLQATMVKTFEDYVDEDEYDDIFDINANSDWHCDDGIDEDDIAICRPVFIWDSVWSSEGNNENRKHNGIYVWRMIRIEDYIDDIIKIIDTLIDDNRLRGILVTRKLDLSVWDFLKSAQYCNLCNLESVKMYDDGYVMYKYDAESG
jgi:hypothetical protein